METNLRQRGNVGGSEKKIGLRIKELERVYGIKNGSSGFEGNQHEVVPNNLDAPIQEQLAKQMDISQDTLVNFKLLAEMSPEIEELLNTGIVTKLIRQSAYGSDNNELMYVVCENGRERLIREKKLQKED